jgi:carbon-monoxide dehydrogenase iron sulfur subunit
MSAFLVIDNERCTGCRNCEMACSLENTRTFNPKRSRIQILKDEVRNLIVPMVCLQCEEPLCQNACPNGAIVRNESGVLTVNHEVCIGCSNCVSACVYGGIELDPRSRKAVKCDLCNGDPACVKACDYGAITLVDREEAGYITRRKGMETPAQIVGLFVEEGTQ